MMTACALVAVGTILVMFWTGWEQTARTAALITIAVVLLAMAGDLRKIADAQERAHPAPAERGR